MTFSARSADFQRAFVALRYFWGARGEALSDGFEHVSLTAAAQATVSQLAHADRTERAKALSSELARVAAALAERSLGR